MPPTFSFSLPVPISILQTRGHNDENSRKCECKNNSVNRYKKFIFVQCLLRRIELLGDGPLEKLKSYRGGGGGGGGEGWGDGQKNNIRPREN